MIKRLFFLLIISFSSNCQYNTAKPWAYWWWMGSAVTKEGIKQNLVSYAKAGFGGLHIIPIYGVKGEEKKTIQYLSPEWFEMLDYTLKEANKNHLGIDMTLGSGWPFGGAQVKAEDGAKSFQINEIDGKLNLTFTNTNQKVKRAGPGGEGLVVDHFDKKAVANYLKPFDDYFTKRNYPIRAFYNDSYEVYGANWTNEFFTKFKKYRRYDLANHLDVLNKTTAETDREKRIWCDYNETISDLLYDEFNPTWIGFAKKNGKLTRNEAHGSPANILDLYAQADIPETEFFGSKSYNIPLYRQDPAYEESRYGTPGALVLKLASSTANIAGKQLVSSETATWLANHFQVSLSQIKPIIDESFVGGVNHIFYHGLPYSPPNEPFPGWLFYASTNFNQNSHFWNELPLLNKYIENSQKILQNTTSDNDILVYLPMYDLWNSVGPNNKTHAINVHTILKEGMFKGDLGSLANLLTINGYSFDFISDKQILKSKTDWNKQIITESGKKYKTIIIPKTSVLSLETLGFLKHFAQNGVKIIFEDKLPEKVNGFYNWKKRQDLFESEIKFLQTSISKDVIQSLKDEGIRKEYLAENGLSFIRKKTKLSTIYFITNQNNVKVDAIKLAVNSKFVKLFNPLNNSYSYQKIDGNSKVSINLFPGESVFIETLNKLDFNSTFAKSPTKTTNKLEIKGSWKIDFLDGKPFIPASYNTTDLISWANSTDSSRQFFSGKAKYTIDFKMPEVNTSTKAIINLGDVRETAKVILNGKDLGTVWCIPFKVEVPKGVFQKENKLEIVVTNLSANRIKFMDIKKIPWKKFYDINIVDIQYKPFDASSWKPVESGLLGPVLIEY